MLERETCKEQTNHKPVSTVKITFLSWKFHVDTDQIFKPVALL